MAEDKRDPLTDATLGPFEGGEEKAIAHLKGELRFSPEWVEDLFTQPPEHFADKVADAVKDVMRQDLKEAAPRLVQTPGGMIVRIFIEQGAEV